MSVPVEKVATAGTVARQRGSQEKKYPNLSLLPPSDLFPLAKPQPEAREQRTLGDEVLRGQFPTPQESTDQGQKGEEWFVGVGHKWRSQQKG